MKRKSKQQLKRQVILYLLFLLNVACVAVCVIVPFAVADSATGSLGAAIGGAAVIVPVVALFLMLVDNMRSHYTIDEPVQKIIEATDKISRGDFSVRLLPANDWDGYDNFDLIADNINKMAAELSRTKMLGDDFVANVSHEIKTPLAIITTYTQLLKDDKLDDAKRAEYIGIVAQASDRLSRLVSDVLKLNKLENQRLFPEKKSFDLSESLVQSVLAFEKVIDEKKIELDCSFPDGVFVVSDESLLSLIWNNLISNAVKFSDEGGKVTIRLEDKGSYVVVSVADNGCGMSADTGEHIFDKFYQGDTSHAKEGNGLGLALVKKVIDVLGGTIAVESTVGEGSTFTVKLGKEDEASE